MNMFKDGLTIGQLVKMLSKVENQNAKILISSDEEQNQVFKGFYIEYDGTELLFAGLSGHEVDE
jgi:predicted glycosyltransferase